MSSGNRQNFRQNPNQNQNQNQNYNNNQNQTTGIINKSESKSKPTTKW